MNLFVNYYLDKVSERQAEIDDCLQRNLASGLFTVHVLKEPAVALPEFARTAVVHPASARPTFADIFRCVAAVTAPDDVNVLANADVYFDDTLRLAAGISADEFIALTRHTIHPNGVCTFYGRQMTQDAWLLRGQPRERLLRCDFPPGLPRCDGRLAFEARAADYRVSNPSLSVKVYHVHHSGIRNYDFANQSDAVPGDVFAPLPGVVNGNGANGAGAPFVSVIIPVYNDSRRLQKCLQALERQTYAPEKFEVIVADNGSSDGVAEVAATFRSARIVTESAPGSYAARNRALSLARGDVLAFTDSDCIPSATWLEQGVNVLRTNPGCGLVGGEIELFYRNPPRLTAVELFEKAFGFPQKNYIELKRYGATANVITCREAFETVGLFNAQFKSGGDNEWGKRVYKAGYKQIYSPETVVQHPARATLREMRSKESRVIGGWYTLNRNQRRLLLGILLMVFFSTWGRLRSLMKSRKISGVITKSRVALVIFYLGGMRLRETLRMYFGGTAKRL